MRRGCSREIYHAMSEHSPHSFDPSPLSGIDVAYFTIGTATTGSGDIRPVSGAGRLLVSAQQITTVYLVVIAITTAVERVRTRDEHAPGEPTTPVALKLDALTGRRRRSWPRSAAVGCQSA